MIRERWSCLRKHAEGMTVDITNEQQQQKETISSKILKPQQPPTKPQKPPQQLLHSISKQPPAKPQKPPQRPSKPSFSTSTMKPKTIPESLPLPSHQRSNSDVFYNTNNSQSTGQRQQLRTKPKEATINDFDVLSSSIYNINKKK